MGNLRISLDGAGWRLVGLMPLDWIRKKVWEVPFENLWPPVMGIVPAVVPGDVQSDLRDAGAIPDPYHGTNSLACEWTAMRDWVLERQFTLSDEVAGHDLRLHFEGVDYSCHVYLNGQHLGDHVGMYDTFGWDISDIARVGEQNRLVVVIDAPPTEPDQQGQIGYTSQIRLWKARFAYGWDWCTRLVPVGIWDRVSIVATSGGRLTDVWAQPEVDAGAEQASLQLTVTHETATGGILRLRLAAPGDVEVASADVDVAAGATTTRARLAVLAPQLWWPNGAGDQPLYTLITELLVDGVVSDRERKRIGFRTVEAVANQDAPEDALPYQLMVNGENVFIRGWNWVPVDQLYGREHRQQYRHFLEMARHANCNLLRVWGGGLLEREYFYDLCDEFGIMVWQEFIQSSSGIDNEPASDPEFLAYIRDQAEKMVPRRRNHASLIIWTAGNELTTTGNQMDILASQPITMDHANVATLAEVVSRLDPGRIFIPSSPSGPLFVNPPDGSVGHDVHAHWHYLGDPDHYEYYTGINPLLHSEFGVGGAANLDTLLRIADEADLWPADATNGLYVHHGSWWIDRPAVERVFGALENVTDYVNASQWIQAEGLRFAIESHLRRQGHCSGVMPWQLNEGWPNTVCTNAVDYFGHAKPAYWAIRDAYSPLVVSAQYSGVSRKLGEAAEWRVFVNTVEPLDGPVEWTLRDAPTGAVLDSGRLDSTVAGGYGASEVGSIQYVYDTRRVTVLEMRASAGGRTATSQYVSSSYEGAALAPILHPAPSDIRVDRRDGVATIKSGGQPIFGIKVEAVADYGGPHTNRGYIAYLGPSSAIEVTARGCIRIGGWNTPTVVSHAPADACACVDDQMLALGR